ncbi:MAG: ferritin family protein [Candidatus Sulfobium sp.]|jgi:rubrerythrin
MVTGKEDLLQSLMEALLMEKGTHDFYSEAAEKAMDPVARQTFSDLSEWEEQHLEYIQSLYLAIQDDRDIERFEEFRKKAPAPVTEGGIPLEDLESKLEEHNFIDDLGALTWALEIEGKAYNLYRRFSADAQDSNARVVFKEMMEQELKHIDYLKEMRMKLAETS